MTLNSEYPIFIPVGQCTFLKRGLLCTATLAVLELVLQSRMASHSQRPACLGIPSAGIKGMCCHLQHQCTTQPLSEELLFLQWCQCIQRVTSGKLEEIKKLSNFSKNGTSHPCSMMLRIIMEDRVERYNNQREWANGCKCCFSDTTNICKHELTETVTICKRSKYIKSDKITVWMREEVMKSLI